MEADIDTQNLIDEEEHYFVTFNTLVQQNFENQLEYIKESEFFKKPENELLIYMGGLLNDTIYKQQKYFRTAGLLKQIVPFAIFITENKIRTMYGKVYRLQKALSIKERKKFPKILNIVKNMLKKISFSLNPSQLEMNLALTSGYNLYGRAVQVTLKTIKEKLIDKSDTVESVKPLSDESSKINIFPVFQENRSFQFGYDLGRYYFLIEESQRISIKTKSLIKKLHPLLSLRNLNAISVLIREINLTALKLLGIRQFNREQNTNFQIRVSLQGDVIEINLFEFFWKPIKKFDRDYFLLGLGAAFTDHYSLKLNTGDDPFELDYFPEPKLDPKGNRIILEEYYIKEYKNQRFYSIEEKLAYLQGILLNSLQYSEHKVLKTNRLIKVFSFLFRNFNKNGILKLQTEIFHTLFSLWIQSSIQDFNVKNYSFLLRRIRLKLLDLFGELVIKKDKEDPSSIIALIQGFNSFNKLFQEYNQ